MLQISMSFHCHLGSLKNPAWETKIVYLWEAWKMKIVDFTNTADSDQVAQSESTLLVLKSWKKLF